MSLAINWFDQECARVANEAFDGYMKTGCAFRVWLYYKRGAMTTSWGEPEGYQLATPEGVPMNLERWQLVRWVKDKTKGLPTLPE
jgi:hypothetical protein